MILSDSDRSWNSGQRSSDQLSAELDSGKLSSGGSGQVGLDGVIGELGSG